MTAALGDCPNCGTPRQPGDAFCEVCGLDWATGQLPVAPDPVGPAGEVEAGWAVTLTPDREWFDRNEAEGGAVVAFPDGVAARVVALDAEVATIGRRDDRNGWYPDIDLGHPVDDLGASRRHAELRWTATGWQLVDTGSTNGTRHNGELLTADHPVALAPGDIVLLGAFTRLELVAPGAGE